MLNLLNKLYSYVTLVANFLMTHKQIAIILAIVVGWYLLQHIVPVLVFVVLLGAAVIWYFYPKVKNFLPK